MKKLLLGDFSEMSEDMVQEHIIREYEVQPEELEDISLLIAYEEEGAYNGTAWFLFRNKKDRKLYEVHGSHCSCYGYEGQWAPEGTTKEYLQSSHFNTWYIDNEKDKKRILEYLSKLK